MPLIIYNSLTDKKEVFTPIKAGEVGMYTCGPTVYDEPHLGHLRSAFVFALIRRALEHLGYKVCWVRNVTDVDDKIIEKAGQSGFTDLVQGVESVSQKYFDLYKKDLGRLGLEAPSLEPWATKHLPDMIQLILRLIEKGAAYENNGDVYFRVSAFKGYGKLSGQKIDAMREGVRGDASENKEDALDFALWKKSKEGEPSWESPWGRGRPGWHIECSAMSAKYLGETFDIHGGGRDLIFPHHENEIAQSEAASGKYFARTWIHHGLVTIDGQKMSKSLGNFVTSEMILEHNRWGLEDLKILFLGTHYRMPLDYSAEKMKMAKAVRERFYFFNEECQLLGETEAARESKPGVEAIERTFQDAMDDDFNTPRALAALHELVESARQNQKDPTYVAAAGRSLNKMLRALGVELDEKRLKCISPGITDEAIERILEERQEAKRMRDFKRADEIRQRLLDDGVALSDTPKGRTTWRRV